MKNEEQAEQLKTILQSVHEKANEDGVTLQNVIKYTGELLIPLLKSHT